MGGAMATTALMSMNRKEHRIMIAGVIYLALLLNCGQVLAQGVEFEGGIQVGVIKTDNALLVPSPDEMNDTVYQLSPFLSLIYENERIKRDGHPPCCYRFSKSFSF